MAKRRSVRQLNKDEADEVDDEPEDSGEFEQADKRELATRRIVTAKRRVVSSADDRPKPLANFAGFSTAASDSPFQFFQKLAAKANMDVNAVKSDVPTSAPPVNNSEDLKALNLSFLNWIKLHLDKDPYVVLLPVFQDYEKHLNSLKSAASSDNSLKLVTSASNSFKLATSSENSFKLATSSENSFKLAASSENSFKLAASSENSFKPTSSDNVVSNNSQSSSTFQPPPVSKKIEVTTSTWAVPNLTASNSINPLSPFQFGSKSEDTATKPQPSILTNNTVVKNDENQQESEESEEPPVSEFVPVGEDGSVFDVRCKLFIKKDGQFNSIGVGKLHLKPLPSGKLQAIARADTTQGSVLLNVIVSRDMPLQKTGKNNVLLVCVPTPEAKPPPLPVLIRVKGAEERDELYQQLDTLRNK